MNLINEIINLNSKLFDNPAWKRYVKINKKYSKWFLLNNNKSKFFLYFVIVTKKIIKKNKSKIYISIFSTISIYNWYFIDKLKLNKKKRDIISKVLTIFLWLINE